MNHVNVANDTKVYTETLSGDQKFKQVIYTWYIWGGGKYEWTWVCSEIKKKKKLAETFFYTSLSFPPKTQTHS